VRLPEKSLIAGIRRMAASAPSIRSGGRGRSVLTGIGDDCAVLRLRADQGQRKDVLVTTDFSLESIHFRRDWHPAQSVGHRCLARGLSDIAAMGGEPVAAFLSLALPQDLKQKWVDDFLGGLLKLAKHFGITLTGGDTAESPAGILADVVVVGSVPQGKAVLRSGARPGDLIYVTGELGGSAAALGQMQSQPKRKLNPRDYPRHFFPQPRIEVGRILGEKNLASSMIDTSDGLSTDLAHLCEESGVGAEIRAAAVPRATVGKALREVDLDLALHGGEDYELLFTASRAKRLPARIAGVAITQIGEITRTRKMTLRSERGIASAFQPQGWEHFRGNSK